MEKTEVSIKEVNATVYHDFPFAVGAEVTIDGDGNKGIVDDAIWKGKKEAPATHYTINYFVKTKAGDIRQLSLNEILGLNPK